MGGRAAEGFADAIDDGVISLDAALHWHLASNHFPPVPLAFIPTCRAAIEACNEGNDQDEIDLPEGIEWKDHRTAVLAITLVEEFHLYSFIDYEEEW